VGAKVGGHKGADAPRVQLARGDVIGYRARILPEAPLYETSDIRKGLKIAIDGQPYVVVDFQFVKPGKGTAFTRTRIKNLITGNVLDKTYKTGEKLEPANVESRTMQYLYQEVDHYVFMDNETYEQTHLGSAEMGDALHFLLPNVNVQVLLFNERPIGVDLPNFVELEVTQSEPGVKGDTASGAQKEVTLSTGHKLAVPLFIQVGDVLRIDTRTGEYVERVGRR
jgi:elongation factor P